MIIELPLGNRLCIPDSLYIRATQLRTADQRVLDQLCALI